MIHLCIASFVYHSFFSFNVRITRTLTIAFGNRTHFFCFRADAMRHARRHKNVWMCFVFLHCGIAITIKENNVSVTNGERTMLSRVTESEFQFLSLNIGIMMYCTSARAKKKESCFHKIFLKRLKVSFMMFSFLYFR